MSVYWDSLQIRLLSVVRVKEGTGWKLQHRVNPFAALWYAVRGSIYLTTQERTIRVPEGSVILLPPEIMFSSQLDNDCSHLHVVVVRFNLWIEQSMNWFKLYSLPTITDGGVTADRKKMWLQLYCRFRHPAPEHHFVATGYLQILLGMMLNEHRASISPIESPANHQVLMVLRLTKWMQENLNARMSLESLASTVPVSPEHLVKLFDQVVGEPPMRHWMKLRLAKARELLRHTDLPVKEISSVLGFHDPLYFSRVFRRDEGYSPSQFRELHTHL